jgi:TonB-dependent receptor
MYVSNRIRLAIAVLAAAILLPMPAFSAASPTVVRGRVLDTSTGRYLLNAQVRIVGANLVSYTDGFGEYIITGAPAGEVTVRAGYGDMTPRQYTITLTEGVTTELNFDMERAGADDQIITLDKFEVQARREADAKMVALNEQRNAVIAQNVVSTDEFGNITEGNIGEFLKYIPGLVVDYNAADARTVSVRGFPPGTVDITMDGFKIASASSGDSSRTFEFEQISINNASRIAVTKSRTPDMPANALGGAVNLVSKSAFERSRPSTVVRAFINMNSTQRDSGAQPIGPDGHYERLIKPGFDLTYINPLSRNLGITVTGMSSNQYNPQTLSLQNWIPVSGNANTATPSLVTASNPYMATYRLQNSPKISRRTSAGITLDWRATRQDVFSLRYQWNKYATNFYIENYTMGTGGAADGGSGLPAGATQDDFGPDHTNGGNAGLLNSASNFRHKFGSTWLVNLAYRHNGPVWKIDAGLGTSQATNHYRDMDDGYFNTVNAGVRNVTVTFSDINSVRPGQITATKGGVAINPFDLSENYTMQITPASQNGNGYAGSASTHQGNAFDKTGEAYVNAHRLFTGKIPIRLQFGGNVRKQTRDIAVGTRVWRFFGPPPSASEGQPAAPYVNTGFSTVTAPFGFGKIQWIDPRKLYDVYTRNPGWFQEVMTGNYSSPILKVNGSQYIQETVSALYLRVDAKFLDNRLWLVGGVRWERTNDDAAGPLRDSTAIYKRDPATGHLLNPLQLVDSLSELAGNDLTLAQNKLMYQERGARSKRNYDGLYPSLGAAWLFTDDLILRTSYARSIARPNFGQIIPETILPTENANPDGFTTINVRNTGLKPWEADAYDLSLDYYFQKSGRVSAGFFYKDIRNFFGTMLMPATPRIA